MGFSADWLALREPADHAARDTALLAGAVRALAARDAVVVDLGCGTGSTRRAFGPACRAEWRMVDSDPALLALAGGESHRIDLRRVNDLPLDGAGLVTASALIDLVSADWLAALVARLADLDVPFYAALSYDGVMAWDRPDSDDAAITAAFNRHQRGDKGFGPALGPTATDHAVTLLQAAGFTTATASSPWRLGPDQAALQAALLPGIAQAATEVGCDADAAGWLARRMTQVTQGHCVIGHQDILALPPGSSSGQRV